METLRIQTGIRLKPELVRALKRKAKQSGQSFNRYVETILEEKLDMELPKLDINNYIPDIRELKFMDIIPEISKEQVESDPKLKAILGL